MPSARLSLVGLAAHDKNIQQRRSPTAAPPAALFAGVRWVSAAQTGLLERVTQTGPNGNEFRISSTKLTTATEAVEARHLRHMPAGGPLTATAHSGMTLCLESLRLLAIAAVS